LQANTPVRFISFIIIFFISNSVFSQKKNESYKLQIQRAKAPIIIDGILDEPDWLAADVATDFYMITPMDTSFAKVRTEVRMAYDNENLYLIATNYHGMPGPYMVESLEGISTLARMTISFSHGSF